MANTPQDRYEAANIRRFVIKVNRNTDPDLLSHLESKDNIQGYILSLIRNDMHSVPEPNEHR